MSSVTGSKPAVLYSIHCLSSRLPFYVFTAVGAASAAVSPYRLAMVASSGHHLPRTALASGVLPSITQPAAALLPPAGMRNFCGAGRPDRAAAPPPRRTGQRQ